MKKRVLSALLALCMACTLAGTVWAAEETVPTPTPTATVEPQTVEPTPTPSADPTPAPAPTPDASEQPEVTVEPSATPDATVEPTATPDATEEPETTETPAPSEEPKEPPVPTAEAEGEPVDDGVEYTASLEQDGQTLNVIVTAPERAFDGDVEPKLSVSAIEDETALDTIASELDSNVEYDGFAALDISFKNEAGEEIEPNAPVKVRIELPDSIVDSGIDLSTLAVQHLEEDAEGNVQNVSEVATLDNGITLSEEAAAAISEAAGIAPMSNALTAGEENAEAPVVAEFAVDGFSTFTITWSGRFRVTIHYVDENGYEIRGTQTEDGLVTGVNDNNPKSYMFSDYAEAIEGYTYDEARYGSYKGQIVTSMTFSQDTEYIFGIPVAITRTLTFYNGNLPVTESYNGTTIKNHEVYLVYTKNEEPGEEPGEGGEGTTTNATVTPGKKTELRADGNYDLTLSISGDRGSKTNPAAVDVLFIVDRSNSMTQEGVPSLINTKTAISTMVTGLENNDNIDARYSIVTFSGPDETGDSNKKSDAQLQMDWTKVDGSNVADSINSITAAGGTDYQAGLDVGTDQLKTARSGATKVVIFLSDGEPTWSYNYGTGGNALCLERHHTWGCTYAGWLETLNQAREISCDYFYAIGIGGSSSSYLDGLVGAVTATTKRRIEAESDGSNLTNLFEDIVSQVNFFAAKNVVMTDPLSEWVDIVPNENDQIEFTVTLEKRGDDGEYQKVGDSKTVTNGVAATFTTYVEDENGVERPTEFKMTPIWDRESETIRVTFDKDYELAPGYRYSVTTTISPSANAINQGKEVYDGTGDSGTGDHANQKGFWSNDNANAKVTYTANDTPGSEPFPKPVIQVPEKTTTTLTLQKTFVGLTDAEVNYLLFGQGDDGFGWDINYCQPELREDVKESGGHDVKFATYMADDDAVKGITLPDGTAVTGGGDFRITAQQFLSKTGTYGNGFPETGLGNINEIEDQEEGYTNQITHASLKKEFGNWVYSVTLEVPVAENGYYYTVFEQHGEVPGYAKLDDSNVDYAIKGIEGLTGGTGKFIDTEANNVYVDMDSEVNSVDVTVEGNRYTLEGEEAAIHQDVFQKLYIQGPTKIAFTNHYTGNLEVSKTVTGVDEADLNSVELAGKEFTITLQPYDGIAHLDLLHGRKIEYTITHKDGSATEGDQAMDQDKDCAIEVTLKYGDTITFKEIPAIQYIVTEKNPEDGAYDFLDYTWQEATYAETMTGFGEAQKVDEHWNHNGQSASIPAEEGGRRYYTVIGTDKPGDQIVSVDSMISRKSEDVRPIETLQITNKYVAYKSLTIEKDITGELSDPGDTFTFTVTGATGITAEDVIANSDDANVSVNNGTITATLGKGDTITINKLTGEHDLTISEDAGSYEQVIDLTETDGYVGGADHSGFVVSGNQVTVHVADVSDDPENGTSLGTVRFENKKSITPPTGLESDHTRPYTLMVTAAGIAGLALIGAVVSRRIRRRRQE